MLEIIDTNAPSWNGGVPRPPAELPHGVIPPPERVLEIVAREEARLLGERGVPLGEEGRRRLTEDLTLQYYFEYPGYRVAYRSTPAGPEVLAVGPEEVAALTEGMSLEERLKIQVRQFR